VGQELASDVVPAEVGFSAIRCSTPAVNTRSTPHLRKNKDNGSLAPRQQRHRVHGSVEDILWGSITGSGLDGLAGWDHP
jgi:hypothetical protein